MRVELSIGQLPRLLLTVLVAEVASLLEIPG